MGRVDEQLSLQQQREEEHARAGSELIKDKVFSKALVCLISVVEVSMLHYNSH